MDALRLRESPDWTGAAQALIAACSSLDADDERVRWLEHMCAALGDALYPAFLRVLCLVGEHGEDAARRNVASTLLRALQSGRLPAGRHAAWGARGMSATRSHGPLEYLCAWYLHPHGGTALSAPAFDRAARALLGLLASDAQAHRLYRARLSAAADDPLEGAWSRTDREALRALIHAWTPGADPEGTVNAFLRSARGAPESAWPSAPRTL
jgi:hypothetical protein